MSREGFYPRTAPEDRRPKRPASDRDGARAELQKLQREEEKLRNALGALLSGTAPVDRLSLGTFLGQQTSLLWSRAAYHGDETLEWGELFLGGFPFRWKKEQITGVRKEQDVLEPLVELSPKADQELMRTERSKYRQWGEEALAQISL